MTGEVRLDGVLAADYVGKTRIRGREVHHLAFTQVDADWQIWIDAGEPPVPVALIGTNTYEQGWPQYRVWFTDWNFAPSITDDTYAFSPPDGAIQTEIVPGAGSFAMIDEGQEPASAADAN